MKLIVSSWTQFDFVPLIYKTNRILNGKLGFEQCVTLYFSLTISSVTVVLIWNNNYLTVRFKTNLSYLLSMARKSGTNSVAGNS